MMEVDMDSTPRTLHYFHNGTQQKRFFRGLPRSVKLAVCLPSLLCLHIVCPGVYRFSS
jgi:hypothetical protein